MQLIVEIVIQSNQVFSRVPQLGVACNVLVRAAVRRKLIVYVGQVYLGILAVAGRVDCACLCGRVVGDAAGRCICDLSGKGAVQFRCSRRREGGRLRRTHFAPFLGPEKESLVLGCVVDLGDIKRTANGEPVVVVPFDRSRDHWCDGFVEVAIGVEYVIAVELIHIAMEGTGPGFGGYQDLSASATTETCVISTSFQCELLNRIDTRHIQQCRV